MRFLESVTWLGCWHLFIEYFWMWLIRTAKNKLQLCVRERETMCVSGSEREGRWAIVYKVISPGSLRFLLLRTLTSSKSAAPRVVFPHVIRSGWHLKTLKSQRIRVSSLNLDKNENKDHRKLLIPWCRSWGVHTRVARMMHKTTSGIFQQTCPLHFGAACPPICHRSFYLSF